MIMKYLVLLACCLTPNTLVTCFKFGVPKIMRSSVSFMFSGIVEEIGTIARVNAESTIELWDGSFSEGVVIDVIGKETLKDAYIGCSISLNGVCLTVTKIDTMLPSLSFGVSKETLRRSNLKALTQGSQVNLERALKNDGRNSGHTVQGHVDCTGVILDKYFEGDSLWIKVEVPEEYIKYIVPKGFIAVDGTSLTICEVGKTFFTFMLVPHTQQNVVIPSKSIGDLVNIEVDVLAKLAENSFSKYIDSKLFTSLINENARLQQTVAELDSRLRVLEAKSIN